MVLSPGADTVELMSLYFKINLLTTCMNHIFQDTHSQNVLSFIDVP